MKEKILDVNQLDYLAEIGVLHKLSDGRYDLIIDHGRWGGACMPSNMVYDLAGKEVDVSMHEDGSTRYFTDRGTTWFISPWMLEKNYEQLKKCGKFIPESWSNGKYTLHIMSKAHLEDLYDKDILSKTIYGENDYVYEACLSGMGDMTFPDAMVDQIAGKTMHCYKPGGCSLWVEEDTEHRWSISEWMLEENYEYLKSRALGELRYEEDDPEEEEEEEEEEEISDRCEASVVGVIEETNPEYITINCSEMSVPVLCYGDAECHGIGERVKVRGKLIRVHNMMGYPEIDITYIEEY